MSLRIRDVVIWHETAEGVSLYHTETGHFHTLNQTGSRIWSLVASDGEREPIVTMLASEYAGANMALAARIVQDVQAFLGTMIERGMLEESPS